LKQIKSINVQEGGPSGETDNQREPGSEDNDLGDELSEDCSSESEASSSESEDMEDGDEPATPPRQCKPCDSPGKPLYVEGLRAMASVLAAKFGAEHPHLRATGESTHSKRLPQWFSCLQEQDRINPSCAMMQITKDLEETFLNQHGNDIDREPKVLAR
jgi:hypothetical protein